MGNRENRFRVLAVILSVLFFCAGIVLTLGIFYRLPDLLHRTMRYLRWGSGSFPCMGSLLF